MLQFLYIPHQLYKCALKVWPVDLRGSVHIHQGVHKLSPLIGMKAHVLHFSAPLKRVEVCKLQLFVSVAKLEALTADL